MLNYFFSKAYEHQGKSLNRMMGLGQISRVFKSFAIIALRDPEQIRRRSSSIGTAQDLLAEGDRIGQVMARWGWNRVMRYFGITSIGVMN